MMIKPFALKPGDTLGVFTPTWPSYKTSPEMFECGLKNLRELGFKIKLGGLTSERRTQGYRSAPPKERAAEMMGLIRDPEVRGLISTVGGANSSSLIPFLDFKAIREARKVICGFSDITSLHLAIAKYSGLKTFYSPMVMNGFAEWPSGIPENTESFLKAVCEHTEGERTFEPPKRWSNHDRDWANGDWKKIPRQWQENHGWVVLQNGSSEGELVPSNLNTLLSAAGTDYFPNLSGKILLVEELDATQSRNERHFRQLFLMGVFDKITGLIVGKPESYDSQGASFSYDELILEVVGRRSYPIVTQFDCSHTVPMLTMPYFARSRLTANNDGVQFSLLEGAIINTQHPSHTSIPSQSPYTR